MEGHYICPDPFYSCPASGQNEVESSTNGCDCGKDKRDNNTREILDALEKLVHPNKNMYIFSNGR